MIQEEFFKKINIHSGQPLSSVSGDCYDFYVHDGMIDGISLFDVSGHGISSALITMIAKSIAFRNYQKNPHKKLSEIADKINNDLTCIVIKKL